MICSRKQTYIVIFFLPSVVIFLVPPFPFQKLFNPSPISGGVVRVLLFIVASWTFLSIRLEATFCSHFSLMS